MDLTELAAVLRNELSRVKAELAEKCAPMSAANLQRCQELLSGAELVVAAMEKSDLDGLLNANVAMFEVLAKD